VATLQLAVLVLSLFAGCVAFAIEPAVNRQTAEPGETPPNSAPSRSQPETAGRSVLNVGQTLSHGRPGTSEWWNIPDVIRKIQLTKEQRAAMNQLWTAANERESASHRAQAEARQRFDDALAAGHWEAARAAVDEWNHTTGETLGAANKLKIDELALLTPEQFQKFKESYSLLLRGTWTGPWSMKLAQSPAGPSGK